MTTQPKRKRPASSTGASTISRLPLLEPVLESIERRVGRREGGFGQYKTRAAWRERVQEVLFDPKKSWLTRPLILALLQDNVDLSRARSQSILYWLCQWQWLSATQNWKGADDFVSLGIRMGATVEDESIWVSAIRGGSVRTLQLLLQAGGTNSMEQNQALLLSRALERANPEILQLVLRHIPATHRFRKPISADLGRQFASKKYLEMTALDYMLYHLWRWGQDENDNDEEFQHWVHLGMPSVDDFAECIWLLLQQGATYTELGMQVLSLFLDTRGAGTTGSAYSFQIAQFCFGNWIPAKLLIKPPEEEEPQQPRQCSICWHEETTPETCFTLHNRNLMTLYCGHHYCFDCIEAWSATPLMYQSNQPCPDLTCPLCRKPLPRAVLSRPNRLILAEVGDRRRNRWGIDGDNWRKKNQGDMTREQIVTECQAQGMLPVQYWEVEDYRHAQRSLQLQYREVKQEKNPKLVDFFLEGTSCSDNNLAVAPKRGPIVLPIRLQDMPLLAGLSGLEPYTIVSPATAQLLELKIKDLTCPKRVGAELATMAVIDKLVVTLGSGPDKIDVGLRNALVQVGEGPPAPSWRPGIVLGKDFLNSAFLTMTSVDVVENDNTETMNRFRCPYLAVDGELNPWVDCSPDASTMPEEFRFYATSGRIFRTSLLHIQPPSNSQVKQPFLLMSAAEDAKPFAEKPFTECEWCCRMFPLFEEAEQVDDNAANNAPPSRYFWSEPKKHGMVLSMPHYNYKQRVYYCDDECEQLARQARCRVGFLITWCSSNVLQAITFPFRFGCVLHLIFKNSVPPDPNHQIAYQTCPTEEDLAMALWLNQLRDAAAILILLGWMVNAFVYRNAPLFEKMKQSA